MVKKDYKPSAEQLAALNRLKAIDKIAKDAGFDDDAFASTEFSLVPFFELIVEECAKVADAQARVYTGEQNEGVGCHGAAVAIRSFSKTIGQTK